MKDEGNKHILFLKSKTVNDLADEYHVNAKKICGLEPHSIPVLDFRFVNSNKLTVLLKSIHNFHGVIFTSPRAVEALLNIVCETIGLTEFKKTISENEVLLFVVGKSTGKALIEKGLQCYGEESGCAENLADYIIEKINPKICSKQLVFLQGNLAKNTIQTKLTSVGSDICSLCVYETIPHPSFIEDFDRHLKLYGDPAFLVFFSPSGAEFYLNKIAEMTKNFQLVNVIALGKTTYNFLKTVSHVNGVAEKPSPESLIQCIKKVMNGGE